MKVCPGPKRLPTDLFALIPGKHCLGRQCPITYHRKERQGRFAADAAHEKVFPTVDPTASERECTRATE